MVFMNSNQSNIKFKSAIIPFPPGFLTEFVNINT